MSLYISLDSGSGGVDAPFMAVAIAMTTSLPVSFGKDNVCVERWYFPKFSV
jgi:hypothetical protein